MSRGSADLGEEHDMGLQQRDGDVPGVVAVAQELDELRRDLGLRLTQRDALQQRLHRTGFRNQGETGYLGSAGVKSAKWAWWLRFWLHRPVRRLLGGR